MFGIFMLLLKPVGALPSPPRRLRLPRPVRPRAGRVLLLLGPRLRGHRHAVPRRRRVPRHDRRVPGRRGRRRGVGVGGGAGHGLGDQPAHPGGEALHQLRRAAAERGPLLPARGVVLQLPPRRGGESVLPGVQQDHALQGLKRSTEKAKQSSVFLFTRKV